VTLGPVEDSGSARCQWLSLHATKVSGQSFTVWILSRAFPPRSVERAAATIKHYVVQEGDEPPLEFSHRYTAAPVLPTLGAWEFLWPRSAGNDSDDNLGAARVSWLGLPYVLESSSLAAAFEAPHNVRKLELLPDVLVGVPSNQRTKDDTRRFDGSDYEMVRLTRENYDEMIRAGLNCFRVDAEQAGWLKEQPVFYWGIGGADVPYPECLYRSTYLGPALFLDEPAVHTRDYVVRPRLEKEPELRQSISPQFMFQAFTNLFHQTVTKGAPWNLMNGLRAREDVDLGAINFPQRNLYAWETMIASAAWQLTGEPNGGPRAIVFEPPGRLGSRRTLPEMNMAYGCQLSLENPANFADILFGFLRGAARAADASWGVSIYGAVDRADAPWLLTHAYDLGATHFFFWDNYQLACVPYSEYLALARHLQAHVRSHPGRDHAKLKRAAEVALLLPPGYNLGHTHMGRGNLWGIEELNLERTNRCGVRYGQVMGSFFTEIERCLRLDRLFDLLWDLNGLKLDGYDEIVRVREDGRVEVITDGRRTTRKGPRIPERGSGKPPRIALESTIADRGNLREITVRARLTEGASPIYYTTGTDRHGVYPNVMVLWELYGPRAEDYRQLRGSVIAQPAPSGKEAMVETRFTLHRPGRYRLRAATTDLAGRSAIAWKEFTVEAEKP